MSAECEMKSLTVTIFFVSETFGQVCLEGVSTSLLKCFPTIAENAFSFVM